MTDPHDWQDTQQLDPAAHKPTPEPGEKDFASTELLEHAELDSGVWAEAADGQCSRDAALFAASQPAPLNIV